MCGGAGLASVALGKIVYLSQRSAVTRGARNGAENRVDAGVQSFQNRRWKLASRMFETWRGVEPGNVALGGLEIKLDQELAASVPGLGRRQNATVRVLSICRSFVSLSQSEKGEERTIKQEGRAAGQVPPR